MANFIARAQVHEHPLMRLFIIFIVAFTIISSANAQIITTKNKKALKLFDGEHPEIMKARILDRNWKFDYQDFD